METKTEIWKDIEGYEGLYQVSNLGRVRSLDRLVEQNSRWGIQRRIMKGRVMTLRPMAGGYVGVMFKVQGLKPKMMLVHRLVANAFIPNPENLDTVNHKDEDKTNNRVENLEWMTMLDNLAYGTGRQRKRTPKRPVVQMTLDGQDIRTFASAKEAGDTLGINPTNITACCRGKYGFQSAGGYRWRYAED